MFIMKFMSLFDAFTGARITSVPCDEDLTDKKKVALEADGYVEISEEEWNYYIGNMGAGANGTGYIRDKITGKPIDAPPAPEPTDAEKKAAVLTDLDARYKADKSELSAQYLDAAMSGDTDTMTAIKDELAALNAKYDADYAALNE
jgi:hypothetical protein